MSSYSVGVDCEEVARWFDMGNVPLESPRYRLFHPTEHAYCRSFPEPGPHYAARWCAKEACRKALWPLLRADLRDIEVISDPDGRPRIEIHGIQLENLGIQISVSLSHTSATAFAVVVAGRTSA